jgi:hypothetical protein
VKAANGKRILLSRLPTSRKGIAEATLRDFLEKERMTHNDDAANEAIASVKWSNLPFALKILQVRKAKGFYEVGYGVAELIRRSAKMRHPKIVALIQQISAPNFDPARANCETLMGD